MKIKKRTLLIDGNYLMKRSFLGAKNMVSRNGNGNIQHIGGLYQFMTMLRKLVKLYNPQKVIVFWDGQNGGKRRFEMFREYKANRKNKSWYTGIVLTEAEIAREEESQRSMLAQRVRIQQYLEELFIRQLEIHEIEGDDLIAYYAKVYHLTENITIYTNDVDICQTIEYPNVEVYLESKKSIINRKNFYNFFGYHHENILIMKMLCGDSADNIPGVEGMGEKSVLKYFPEIAERKLRWTDIKRMTRLLLEGRKKEKQKPLKVLENLLNSEDQVLLNYKLMDLSEPMLTGLEKKEVQYWASVCLDDEDRGSKNLIPMMNEDGFLQDFNGNFVNYVKPFYQLIMEEKQYFKIHGK